MQKKSQIWKKSLVKTDLKLQGGPDLVSTFIQLSLIDEYRIGVVPIILGAGKSLFKDVKDRLNLKLLKTKTFNSGFIIFHYQPCNKEIANHYHRD